MSPPALVWFRDDYRLADHPALAAAVQSGAPVLCFSIIEDNADLRVRGAASRWWLHGSLETLTKALQALGTQFLLFRGSSETIIPTLVARTKATAIFWNRRYGPAEIEIDSRLKSVLGDSGTTVESFSGRLLNEPWRVKNRSGRPFRIFTPYSRVAMNQPVPPPLAAPRNLNPGTWPKDALALSVSLSDLALEPRSPNWAEGFSPIWDRGERAARRKLAAFVDSGLRGYSDKRDRPGLDGSSSLSPHLRFGEISPRQVWHAVAAAKAELPELERDASKFLTELTWRDFCHQLLFDFPTLASAPHLPGFELMPWSGGASALTAWQRGETGYPIVDAGMRQLWRTGWMHNRVRMITASFLVKHLLVDWREGERWFWDTLVDADPANNAFNWQWVAGSGPDSAPFHRIFNPVTQGEKFDPDGTYVRAFVPELARLPDRYLHRPWEAPEAVLAEAKIVLGTTYPRPLVDHAAARDRALQAFRTMREANG